MRKRLAITLAVAAMGCAAGRAQTKPLLDTTTFVVMGDGLAAGMANYGLSSVVQKRSFPAQMAAQMHALLVQPLIQPPGIGDVVGYPAQEVRLQTYPQGTVREFYQPDPKVPASPTLFITNLSIPGLTLADSVSLRPVAPIAQANMKQTVVNMILGFPQLFLNNVPLWTQFEYAKAMFPTVALVELGYTEALDAAVSGDPSRLPDPATFGVTYTTILKGLRGLQAQTIATTIPNPLDTAYFNSPDATAAITATVPFVITAGYQIAPQDYVTRNGLMAISNQFSDGAIAPLPAGSVLKAATAAELTARINALNAQIVNAASASGAVLYDLNGFLHKVKTSGVTLGNTVLNGDYLGGFYSMDGVYPGATGHTLIANEILALLNRTYNRSFTLIDVPAVAGSDQNTAALRPRGQIHHSIPGGSIQ